MQNRDNKHRNVLTRTAGCGVLLAFLILLAACSDRAPPVVEAHGETLEGLWEGESGNIAAFKGVPFAAPPVGDLRWRLAVPNTPRKGQQDATEFAPGCMQTTYTTDWYARVAAAFGHGPEEVARPHGVSEDCLYLNVWSPQLAAAAKLPVMVWVHGGSNYGGWSYEPNYLGERLAAKGVVLVSIAYRMGPFGFFSHPVLDDGEGEPIANFGWLDAAIAFQWVAKNIQAFGGDPENITAMGESSGAGNISDWAVVESGENRIARRTIAQSPGGSLDQHRTLADEQETGIRLIDSLGIKDELTAARLRAIPAQDLLGAAEKVLAGHYYEPVLDGLTLKEQPIENLNRGNVSNLDLLIGTNADEWYMYVNEQATGADLERWIENNAPGQKEALLAAVKNETDPRRALDRLHTAKDTLCPLRFFAGKATAMGGRGWVYYFNRQRPGPGGEKLGAYHGTEIPYVFDTHDEWLPTEPADHELTDAVMDYWAQFARTGDPNIKGRPGWPIYVSGRPYVMALGEEIRVMEPHDAGLCQIFTQERPRP